MNSVCSSTRKPLLLRKCIPYIRKIKSYIDVQKWLLFESKSLTSQAILGIETSCDDTGVAVLDMEGNILGEALQSQLQIHLDLGGIIPHIARDLHQENIKKTVDQALKDANLGIPEISAIAVTVKPGMPLSLAVGTHFAKNLCKSYRKPLIPIHHMEAHALTARMVQEIHFPFMVLLVSGGHCLLAVAKSIDDFMLLGESIDTSPGEVLDKAARRLKLKNIPTLSTVSGGKALEQYAKQGNPRAYDFGVPLYKYRDCSFSFAGLKTKILKFVEREELKYDLEPDAILPNAHDICASFQHTVFAHICKRLQRGMMFENMQGLLPKESKTLVVSGGVACNSTLRKYLEIVCAEMDYKLVCPPPKLCTDNGIMIAWNGVEKWKAGTGIAHDIDAVDIDSKAKFGTDFTHKVRECHIPVKWIKLLSE